MNRRRRGSIDLELDAVRARIETLQHKALGLRRAMEELRRLEQNTTAERDALQRTAVELGAQRDAIHWLPPEILMQVFVALVDMDGQTPGCQSSLVISHVSRKWRTISLATPTLWSRIRMTGSGLLDGMETFVERSGDVPLDIEYLHNPAHPPHMEADALMALCSRCEDIASRVVRLHVDCRFARSLPLILSPLQDSTAHFPNLRTLSLSTCVLPISPVEETVSNYNQTFRGSEDFKHCLLHLKLNHVPLLSLPRHLVGNLRSLELSYGPRQSQHYHLRMSALCAFLESTPQLQELTLLNTVPFFDVSLLNADGDTSLSNTLPLKLLHLQALDWSFPYPHDMHRFLSMIDAPSLEKLDVWIGDFPSKRTDTYFLRGYNSSTLSNSNIVQYPSLRELNVQCTAEDTVQTALRRFSFPVLQSATFTNVSETARRAPPTMPIFPRLESIFRDPRLLHLTHLTLAYFKLDVEDGRVESMLGYMPVLVSLTLDSCLNVGTLADVLNETLVTAVTVASPSDDRTWNGTHRTDAPEERPNDQLRRGVKVCPRLESLSLWGCHDLEFGKLRTVVLARNRSHDSGERNPGDRLNGETNPVTREALGNQTELTGAALSGSKGVGAGGAVIVGRKIKPLRKPRRVGWSRDDGRLLGCLAPPQSVVTNLIAMREAYQPARISYIRIANCSLISETEANDLAQFGGLDVCWSRSEGT